MPFRCTVLTKPSSFQVRVHYELHATGNFVARHKVCTVVILLSPLRLHVVWRLQMIRALQCMRSQQEQRLVRVDNGEKELDRQGADLMLKVRSKCHSYICILAHLLSRLGRSAPPSRASARCLSSRKKLRSDNNKLQPEHICSRYGIVGVIREA